MTDINVPDAEFEDTSIASFTPNTNNVNTSNLTVSTQGGGSSVSSLIFQLDLEKRPRFIPYLGTAPAGNVATKGYTSESAISGVTAFAVLAGQYGVFLIDRTLDLQDLGAVTYNKVTVSPNVDWTTPGGMDDVEYGTTDCVFDQTSAGVEYDIPLGARLVRHAMFNKTNFIVHMENGGLTVFASQEVNGGNELILRGRFATRNRENPIRSRRFGVR